MGIFSGSGTENLVEEQILNSWNSFIPTGAGRGGKFYEAVKQFIATAEIPDVLVETKNVAPLSIKRRGQKDIQHECLHIHGTTGPIAGYDVYVVAWDYGKHLIVTRYLAVKASAGELSLFEKEELGACLNLVQSGVIHATEQLMTELRLDLSKINKESTGSHLFSHEN